MTDKPHGIDDQMVAYYEQGKEQERLLRNAAGRLEFMRTRELLARYLPAAPATVLDVGGGTGAYALPLAADGYTVHLIDPMPLHVEQASAASASQPEAVLADVRVGDARRLPFGDRSMDTVLLLGPLYHLTTHNDRVLALQEACRVVRAGGLVFAVSISRFASTYDALFGRLLEEPEFEKFVERDLTDGQHRNPEGRPGWFTTAYFHLPRDLEEEMTEAGLSVEALLGIEGPGWLIPDLDAWLEDPEKRAKLLTVIRRVESEPSLLGASGHLLAVGRRP